MALYEHVFLARQDISNQQVEQLVEQLRGILETNGGKIGKVENWGLKTLTFRIKKNRKAYYTLMNIDAPSAAVGVPGDGGVLGMTAWHAVMPIATRASNRDKRWSKGDGAGFGNNELQRKHL